MIHDFAVIGLGRFGLSVVRTLTRYGYPVLAVDSKQELIEEIADEVDGAACVDTTDKDALVELDMGKFSCVVVGIGSSSLEASILTTALLSQIGCPRIISRAIHSLHEKVLRSVGAHEVVNPEAEIGKRLAEKLSKPYLIEQINLGPDLNLAEMGTPQKFSGKALVDLKLRNEYDISVVAIYRGDTVISNPGAHEVIQPEDKLVVIGSSQAVSRVTGLA